MLWSAAGRRPERLRQLRDDSLTELVPRGGRARRRRGRAGTSAGADCASRRCRGRATPPGRRRFRRTRARGGRRALLRRLLQAPGEVEIVGDTLAPALHPACRLHARHRGDQMRTCEVVRRRERLALVVIGVLLRDGRKAVRQRTATRRKARGGRPSWRATTSRSSIAPQPRRVRAQPGVDALDDVQPLAGPDEAEVARGALERLRARRAREPARERIVLGAKMRDLGASRSSAERVQVSGSAAGSRETRRARALLPPPSGGRSSSGEASSCGLVRE